MADEIDNNDGALVPAWMPPIVKIARIQHRPDVVCCCSADDSLMRQCWLHNSLAPDLLSCRSLLEKASIVRSLAHCEVLEHGMEVAPAHNFVFKLLCID